MYKKEILDQIAGKLGLNAEEFAQGLTSEQEVELTLPNGIFLSDDDKETLLDNHGKARYDAGKTAGEEILLKDMSKLAGFDESIKDKSKFLETYKSKVEGEANIKPNEKVKELETSLETLRGQIAEKDSAYSELQGSLESIKQRSNLLGSLPKIKDDLGLNKDEVLDMYLKSHKIVDGTVEKDGVILKDNLEKPISVNDSLNNFITERGWNFQESGGKQGRGGRGTGGQGAKLSYEDYMSELKEKGLHEGSAEAQSLLKEYAEQNPEILN